MSTYLDPMRVSENTAFAEWEEEFAQNREKELALEQSAELFAVLRECTAAANLPRLDSKESYS